MIWQEGQMMAMMIIMFLPSFHPTTNSLRCNHQVWRITNISALMIATEAFVAVQVEPSKLGYPPTHHNCCH